MNAVAAIEPQVFEFETARLHMRPLQASDEALFCGLYTDAETMRFIAPAMTAERALKSFRKTLASWHSAPLQRAFFAVVEKARRVPLGLCAISRFERATGRAEIGIMLAPGASGRGYAREALGTLVAQTFERFPTQEIVVECSALNPVVERMVSSIGFRLCAAQDVDAGPLAQRIWALRRAPGIPGGLPDRAAGARSVFVEADASH